MRQLNPNVKPYLAMWGIALVIIALMFTCGCSQLRPYNQVAKDYPRSEEKRNILAPVCKIEFPTDVRKDSSEKIEKTIVKDTSGNAILRAKITDLSNQLALRPDCPQINKDSLIDALLSQLKPEIHTIVKTQRVVETKIDSAGMKILQTQYGQLQSDYQKVQIDNQSKQNQINQLKEDKATLSKWKLYFIIAVVVGGIGIAAAIKFF